MKLPILLGALLLIVINSTAQITTADNGITSPDGTKVQLGGSLLQTTNIDLGGSHNFHFKKNGSSIFSMLNNGNVGIGIGEPGARLSFPNVDTYTDPIGITWYSPAPLYYGIHRTAGPWNSPDYQQLRLGWHTGIVLDPGTSYGKSYVDIVGNGLRVTQGNVGIGTATPHTPLAFGNNLANAKIALWEGEYSGQIYRHGLGVGNGQFRLFIPSSDNRFSFLSNEEGTNEVMTIQGAGNVGIGNATPHSKLEVGSSPADDASPNTSSIWDTYNTRFNNGNVSIFSSGTATTAGDSYQLNFYGRYHDGGQGKITSKAAYIKGSVVTVRANEGAPWEGRGSLVLGSSNTSYGPAGFTDVPVMYLTNGQVGIGIAAPATQLHTTGSVRFAGLTNDNAKDRVIVSDANGTLSYRDAATLGGSSSAGWAYGGNAVPASSALGTTSNYDLPIVTNNTERMRIGANGNVGIGTTKITGYKLSVDGIIRSRKVRVDQDTWADYVFDNNYQLRSIKELEQFIQEQKHLPDVPSAAEVKKEGLDLGDNQAILLKKIEELTLYIIQQQKQLEAQQKRMDMLEKKVGNK